MRGLVLLAAAVASAQDNRGFVNERLVTQDFVNNALKAKKPVIVRAPTPARCAVPLLQMKPSKATDPKMVVPAPRNVDEKMILPTMPVCPQR